MHIDRRTWALAAVATGLTGLAGIAPAVAGSPDEEAVAKNLEAFRAAQFAADGKALAALCMDELSYSHSSGVIQNKSEFLAGATAGKSKMISLQYKDPSIRIVGPAAIVRFHWLHEAQDVADGKKSGANLHILMNWLKVGSDWKLLSRGATKL